jgi:hypothetical protein
MDIKTFCKMAVENGYKKSNVCVGWDWIRENLSELDHIFDTDTYRICNGMKYKCMPLIVRGETLTEIEEDILSTAWYLNNDRERKIHQEKYRQKMFSDGWSLLTEELCLQAIKDGKKVIVSGKLIPKKFIAWKWVMRDRTTDWLSQKVENTYKVVLGGQDGKTVFLLPPRNRTRGLPLWKLLNCGETDCFCKLTT